MKGSNKMQFNEATMIEAVQMYVDDQFKEGKSPLVTSVALDSARSPDRAFEVQLTDRVESEEV